MSNGIYEVNFKSNLPDHGDGDGDGDGDGLVVIKDGSVNGGDSNYLYQGNVPLASGKFSEQFQVSMWRPGTTSVAGIDNFILDATGEINYEQGEINLTGSVLGAPDIQITLTGKKIAPAV